uniref:Uncharacterized protein n=1 Tax=Glossina brevipalpis TaxID=37001 RepID=A0A1A9W3T1_9MUSC
MKLRIEMGSICIEKENDQPINRSCASGVLRTHKRSLADSGGSVRSEGAVALNLLVKYTEKSFRPLDQVLINLPIFKNNSFLSLVLCQNSKTGNERHMPGISLERIAEELMGLRKWKQYQETLMRSYLNSEQFIAIIDDNAIIQKKDLDKLADREDNHREEEKTTENHFTESNSQQASQNLAQRTCVQHNSSFTKSLANNSITPNILKANIDLKLPECPSLQQQPRSPTSQPRIEPIDWKPNDKCYFCVNGKLLTVNAKGELVAESGPTGSETDHMQRLDCDTDSNESSTLTTNVNNLPFTGGHLAENNRITLNKLLTPHLKTMTSMDSMAVRLAAIQSISGQLLPNFNWMGQQQQTSSQAMQQQQQQQQIQPQQNVSVPPTTSDTLAAAISPTLKESPNSSDATGEQPLDLSSKPSPNSSLIGDLKSVR